MNKYLTFKDIFYRSTTYVKRNSPTILTCLGAAGVVMTSVMTAKATSEAIKTIENEKQNRVIKQGCNNYMADNGELLSKGETLLLVWKCYVPTAIVGASTIICIFGSNTLNKRKQASLTSAYALLSNYHKEYCNKLIELHGKEIDEEVRNAIARECCNFHQIGLDIPDRKVVFYDEISGRSIVRYEREVMDAEYHLNRNFVLRGYASLNEFYRFLGLPETDYGEELGWSISNGYYWIDFEHRLISRDDGGTEVYSIDILFSPDADYLQDWL